MSGNYQDSNGKRGDSRVFRLAHFTGYVNGYYSNEPVFPIVSLARVFKDEKPFIALEGRGMRGGMNNETGRTEYYGEVYDALRKVALPSGQSFNDIEMIQESGVSGARDEYKGKILLPTGDIKKAVQLLFKSKLIGPEMEEFTLDQEEDERNLARKIEEIAGAMECTPSDYVSCISSAGHKRDGKMVKLLAQYFKDHADQIAWAFEGESIGDECKAAEIVSVMMDRLREPQVLGPNEWSVVLEEGAEKRKLAAALKKTKDDAVLDRLVPQLQERQLLANTLTEKYKKKEIEVVNGTAIAITGETNELKSLKERLANLLAKPDDAKMRLQNPGPPWVINTKETKEAGPLLPKCIHEAMAHETLTELHEKSHHQFEVIRDKHGPRIVIYGVGLHALEEQLTLLGVKTRKNVESAGVNFPASHEMKFLPTDIQKEIRALPDWVKATQARSTAPAPDTLSP